MDWTTTSIVTQKEKDTNPNVYIERAERELKNFNYNGAIKEIDEAISLANEDQKGAVKAQKVEILEKFSKKAVSLIESNNIEEAIKNLDFYIDNKRWVENTEGYKQEIENIIVTFLINEELARKNDTRFYRVIEIVDKCINLTNSRNKYNQLFDEFKAISIIEDLKNILRFFDISEIRSFNIKADVLIKQLYNLNRQELIKRDISDFLNKILKPNYLNINKFNIEDLLDTTNMLIPFSANPNTCESLLNEYIKDLFEKVSKKSKDEEKVVNWLNLVKNKNKYIVLEYEELVLKIYDKYNKHSKLFDDILNNKISMYQNSYIIFANDAYELGESKKAVDIVNKVSNRNNRSLQLEGEKIKLKAYKDLKNVDEVLKIYDTLLIKYLNPYKNEDEEILKEYYKYIIINKRYKEGEILLNKYLENYSKLDRNKRKLINKYLAKFDIRRLRIDKYMIHKYNSSLLKNVEYFIRENISFLILISFIGIIAFFSYSNHMYVSGKWQAKIISADISFKQNVLIGEEIPYKINIKTKPIYVKLGNISVVSTNPDIAEIQDNKIITKNEGIVEIEVYANNELINTSKLNVYK